MKRSSVLRAIQLEIHKRLGTYTNGYALRIAENVLNKIEQYGMLPPPTYMKGMPEVEGNRVVLEWDDENEEELYGESVVAEVNVDIKKLKQIVDSFGEM